MLHRQNWFCFHPTPPPPPPHEPSAYSALASPSALGFFAFFALADNGLANTALTSSDSSTELLTLSSEK